MGRPARRRLRERDSARHDADGARAERPRLRRQRVRGAENEPCPAHETPRRPWHAPRELDVGSPELEDERLPRPRGRQRRGKPVRMDDVGVTSRATRGPRVRDEKRGNEQRLPRAPAHVADDAVAVREAEVAKRRRRDDGDLDSRGSQVLDGVPDEDSCDVVRLSRIRRRQDDDLHSRRAPRATTGSAAARVAKT